MANELNRDLGSDGLAALWSDIAAIRVGMLNTCDGGVLRGRPVLVCSDPEEGAFYVFTRAQDHKVTEIRKDARVCVSFVDSRKEIYISASGKATILRDTERARKYAVPEATAWFEKGVDDSDLRLIRISLEQAERWDVNTNPIRKAWEIVRSMNSPHTPDLTENSKFCL